VSVENFPVQKTVIILAGPTAVGKTSVALEVARHFSTEIISADSRQCYRQLNIGVARPSPEQLSAVKHHFIASHSIHKDVTAAVFETFALQKVEEIFQKSDVVVMTGGTGLYIKAFTEGLDAIPEIPEEVRQEITEAFEQDGMEWLQQEVEKSDPLFYATGEIKNPRRMMRALEVIRFTGQSIITFRKGSSAKRNFQMIRIGLNLPKEQLHENIRHRVDQMMTAGLEKEAKSLWAFQHLKALQTVGYRELFSFFNGEINLAEAVASINKNTRHYAKRQLTWFRKENYNWMEPDARNVIEYLKNLEVRSNKL
jgi:tRNA dimethylallyltransferase